MLRPLPRNILDFKLHRPSSDQPRTLKCCIVCETWIRPTRKRLFNHVAFRLSRDVGQWKETSAHCALARSVYFQKLAVSERNTLLAFHGVLRSNMDTDFWHGQRVS